MKPLTAVKLASSHNISYRQMADYCGGSDITAIQTNGFYFVHEVGEDEGTKTYN